MKKLFTILMLFCSVVALGLDEISQNINEADCSVADKLLASNDYSKAVKAYTKVIKSNPYQNCMQAYYGRALAYYNKQKWKSAIEDLEIAIELSEGKDNSIYNHCSELLETAKTQRQIQLENREQFWSSLSSVFDAAGQLAENLQGGSNSSSSSYNNSSSSYSTSSQLANNTSTTSGEASIRSQISQLDKRITELSNEESRLSKEVINAHDGLKASMRNSAVKNNSNSRDLAKNFSGQRIRQQAQATNKNTQAQRDKVARLERELQETTKKRIQLTSERQKLVNQLSELENGGQGYTNSNSGSQASRGSDNHSNSSKINNSCTHCYGTGHCSNPSAKNIHCNGSGNCYTCNGKGFFYTAGDETACPNCDKPGRGGEKMSVYVRGNGKCKTCHGTGKCIYCNGTGKTNK